MPAVIDAAKCNGCLLCDLYCPVDVIHMEGEVAVVRYVDECWHCGACRLVCAQDAVSFEFSLDMMTI
jgi:ferredoxin